VLGFTSLIDRVVVRQDKQPIREPSAWWKFCNTLKLIRDGSLFIPLLARVARRLGLAVIYSELYGHVRHADGTITNYGLLGRNVITDAGVAFLADDFGAGGSEISNMKFHGYGTGTTNEAASQTALVTELTTEYASNIRPTGTQSDSTNTYTTVGTLTPDSGGTLAITEHGIFSASSAGTLWDRTKFTAINLDSTAGDSLVTTYVATFPSGG